MFRRLLNLLTSIFVYTRDRGLVWLELFNRYTYGMEIMDGMEKFIFGSIYFWAFMFGDIVLVVCTVSVCAPKEYNINGCGAKPLSFLFLFYPIDNDILLG